MLLSARILDHVLNVNSYGYAQAAEFTEGDVTSVYFQLIDRSLDKATEGFCPPGRRYMPADGATLSVVIDSIDDNKKITRSASQPFDQDPSIWRINILSTDALVGTARVLLTLTEGSTVTRANIPAAIRVCPAS
jgi:hypothetical protein